MVLLTLGHRALAALLRAGRGGPRHETFGHDLFWLLADPEGADTAADEDREHNQ